MDAKKFVKEFYRMCESIKNCDECGLDPTKCDITDHNATDAEIDYAIDVINRWSKEHPIEYNRDVIMRLLPVDKCSISHRNKGNGNWEVVLYIPEEWWSSEFRGVQYD